MQKRPVLDRAGRIPVFNLNVPLAEKTMAAAQTEAVGRQQRPEDRHQGAVIHLNPEEFARHSRFRRGRRCAVLDDRKRSVGVLFFITGFLLAVAAGFIEFPNSTVWGSALAADKPRVMFPLSARASALALTRPWIAHATPHCGRNRLPCRRAAARRRYGRQSLQYFAGRPPSGPPASCVQQITQ